MGFHVLSFLFLAVQRIGKPGQDIAFHAEAYALEVYGKHILARQYEDEKHMRGLQAHSIDGREA
jgi:hypothetical protein